MATLTLVLENRRANKEGKFPLLFRISIQKKSTYINTGIHLNSSEFNSKRSVIVSNTALNARVKQLEAEYHQKLNLILVDHPFITDPVEIKNKLLAKTKDEVTIQEFWEEHIESLYISGRTGGATVYKTSLSAISRHVDLEIPFRKFGYRELMQLENKLFKSGVSVNGIGVYFRSLRAIFNKAINSDLVSSELYPFRKYKIKSEKTTPRVLSLTEIRAYFQFNLTPEDPNYVYWNIGKLIFMLRGINITDLLQLNQKSLKNERIIYKRSKTGKVYSIALTPHIKALLSEFQTGYTLLGLIDEEKMNSRKSTTHLIQKRKVINKHLKQIGVALELKEELTTYVFRYTYANIAKQMGYSKDLIAEALGHEYGNSVTGIYLEQFDQEIIDKMNDEIIKSIIF